MKKKKGIVVALLLAMLMASFISVIALPSLRTENKIYIEKASVNVGEDNTIGAFTNSRDISLIISNDEKVYKYLAIQGDIRFIPEKSGEHKVRLVNLTSEKIIEEAQFIALPKAKTITTDKQNYTLSETVIITIPSFEPGERIIINSSFLNYVLLNPINPTSFKPKIVGEYNALYFSQDTLLATTSFNVIDSFTNNTQTQSAQPANYPAPIKFLLNLLSKMGIGDEKSETKGIGIKIKDALGLEKNGLLQVYDAGDIILDPIIGKKYTKAIVKVKGLIDEIELDGITYRQTFDLKIDDVPKQNVIAGLEQADSSIDSASKISKVYAINPESIEFTSGKVTVTATGSNVYKCKDWNFASQTCTGTWVFVKKTIPGEQYTLDIGPNDPAYAETGVSSVNTKKPIYLVGESADIIAVILDRQGYLVNDANITLTVTSPDGVVATYSNYLPGTLRILHASRGIYLAQYTDTMNPGTYTIDIRATSVGGAGVDSQFSTYFEVRNNYDYEISRNTPVTIDPFQGAFSSSIHVTSLNGMPINTFTEVIPYAFGIVDAGGASISSDETSIYLTWNVNAMETTVNYVLQAPPVSPDLYALGQSFVKYNNSNNLFYEARPWYIAIDPTLETQKGLFLYDDTTNTVPSQRNWTGTTVQTEEKIANNLGSNAYWSKMRCMKKQPQCIYVTLEADNSLDMQIYDTLNASWSAMTTIDASLGFNNGMAFDVECEDLSGRCMIAYESGTTNDRTFYYRFWNGTTLSGASTATLTTGANGYFIWLDLYPEKGTDNMGIAFQQNPGNPSPVQAGWWNSTTFGNWQLLSSNSQDRNDQKHFSCGFEGNTSKFVCFLGEDSTSTLNAFSFNKTTWTNLGSIYTPEGKIQEIAACGSSPLNGGSSTQDIGMVFCEANSYRDGGVWNGTTFSKTTTRDTPDRDTASECAGRKITNTRAFNGDCKIDKNKDKIVFVWIDNGADYAYSGTYTISTKTWSMSAWSVAAQVGSDVTQDVQANKLVVNPSTNEMMYYQLDGAYDIMCASWNGESFDSSNCGIIETSASTRLYFPVAFDYHRFLIQPDIMINFPKTDTVKYNYSGITSPSSKSAAYEGGNASYPPAGDAAPLSWTEITSGGYINISTLDGIDHRTTITMTGSEHVYHSFKFYVTQSASDLVTLTFTHRGHATQQAGTASAYNIYAYNYSLDNYTLIKTVSANPNDITTSSIIDGSFSDFINNGAVWFLVMGQYATVAGGGSANRADLFTDYADLSVETIPSLRGFALVNATAFDDDGISMCQYDFFNTTYSHGYTRMNTTTSDDFLNATNTSLIPNGKYTLVVNCNDTLNNRRNASMDVRINNEVPSVYLMYPYNGLNLTYSNINFTWNASNSAGSSFICNATIDGTPKITSVVIDSGNNVTRNYTVSDGTHYWNVSCTDSGGILGTSSTWMFDTDTVSPTITLNIPLNNSNLTKNNMNFSYTPTDAHPINNCSLILNNAVSQTNSTITKSVLNYFFSNLPDGYYNWTVNCTDSFGFTANSIRRSFKIDSVGPTIVLSTPDWSAFANGTAILNYTATDNMDKNLTCNLSINGQTQLANIPSANNTLMSINLSVADGEKTWYVTCWDNSKNTNTSETRTFTVVGAPSVVLLSPPDFWQNNGINTLFTYYTGDGDGIFNCSLIIDNTMNETKNGGLITNFGNNTFNVDYLSAGWHNWTVNCTDWKFTVGSTPAFNLFIDKIPPRINLTAPYMDSIQNAYIIQFNFTASDTVSENMTCNITIDNIVKSSGVSARNNTPTLANISTINGVHWWNVTCLDIAGNANTSLNWNFTTNVTFPVNVTVVTDKKVYQQGELALINTTTRNETLGNLSSNVTTDIIYTNSTKTSITWWNTSWERRKPVYLTNALAQKVNGAVYVNVTGLAGMITGCQKEIRVVEIDAEKFGRMINRSIIDGDDATYCSIVFYAKNISANAVNESNYYVYFNNSYATVLPDINYTDEAIYDFNSSAGTINRAYEIDSNNNPPTSINSENQLTGGDYTNIATSNNGRWQTIDPGNGDYVSMHNFMQINQSAYLIRSINYFFEGNPSVAATIYIYARNLGTSSWDSVASRAFATGADSTLNGSVTSSLNNYVNGTNYAEWAITYGSTSNFFNVDYVKMTVYYNNITPNITAKEGFLEIHVNRTFNQTGPTGRYNRNFDTTGRITGNYSAVSGATSVGYRFGFGFDFFEIIGDTFGPNVTLYSPPTGQTNNTIGAFFNFSVYDVATGVSSCRLMINGQINQTITPITETVVYNFTIPNISEGYYNWTVNCTDSNGNTAIGLPTRILTIDNTPPYITAWSPDNIAVSVNDITFNFTARDNFAASMQCNVSVDDGLYKKGITAQNNTLTSVTILSIPNGVHWWNVTCYDNARNSNTSNNANVSIDALPVVKLDAPRNGYGTNETSLTFYYNLSETGIQNCSLIINNQVNQTKYAIDIPYKNFDGINNFTADGFLPGYYNWTVNCTDGNDFTGTDTKRDLQIDPWAPWIVLNNPLNDSNVFTKSPTFNLTAYDIVDQNLTCNLTIDDQVNQTEFFALNGVDTLITSPGFGPRAYYWNVTCWDNTGFTNTSDTWVFNVSSAVNVLLVSPANNSADMDGNILFTYQPQSIAEFFEYGSCDLYIDTAYSDTKYFIINDAINNFTWTGLAEGNHNWYVNCTDNYGATARSDEWFLIADFRNPWITTYYPDGQLFSSSSVYFNWTAVDNVATTLLCNVSVNNTKRAFNIVSQNDSVTSTTISGLPDGTLAWNVSCLDTSGRLNTSATKTFTINEPPQISLNNPSPGYRTTNQNNKFYFTPTDNSGSVKNCTIILNDVRNNTNTNIAHGVQNEINVSGLPDNQYNWSVNCTDPSGNTANSSTRTMYVDLWPPWINITQPIEGQAFNTDDILFNWTAIDQWGTNLWCNLTIDTNLNQSNLAATSGVPKTYLLENMSLGRHNFTITCWDDLYWTNFTNITSFIVNAPDLTLNDSNIAFNNTVPGINESITINATIFNKGGYPAFNAIIGFWDGLPGIGTYLGNATIAQLDPQENITVNITWNISEGMHELWVVADPDDLLVELNDSNNNATRNISALVSIITSPPNASWTNNLTNSFNFTLAGFVNPLIYYRVFVDGILNGQSGAVNDYTTNGIDITFVQGARKVKIEANDSSGRFKNSSEITIYVDTAVPTITFQTLNNTWFNRADPTIRFTISDNLDLFLNYTLYLNGETNITSVANSTATWNNTLQDLTNGTYYMSISSYDDAGNVQNTSNLTIYIDTVQPSITLNYPSNDENFTNSNPEINFTATDNMAPVISCNLTIDNLVLRSVGAQNNTIINTTISAMSEGTHYWNVSCYDNATNSNTSSTRYFNSFQPPIIDLSTPANNSWSGNENVTFFFNASDDTGIENCSIILNGAINQTKWTENITNNGINNFTINYLNGTYNWSIMCFDNTTFSVKGNSKNWTLSVDIEMPNPGIETGSGIWFGTSTPSIRYNITDNMAAVLSYIFFVDGILNKNGIVNNGISAQTGLNTVSDGWHALILQGSDTANNSKNTTPIFFGIDTSIPYITLNYPLNGNVSENNSMTFNFTAIDATSANLTCNLTIDKIVIASFNSTNNTPSIITLDNLEFGFHYWNVTCLDFALNLNTSQTWNFSIPAPDVMINATDITFNNTNPKEGENVTINATIYNTGKSTARNFTVQFWDGNWTNGLWIANISINSITAGGNLTIGTIWTAKLGQHEIYVIVDAPLDNNGTIKEVNETNNYAFNTIGIIFWHFFSGNVSGNLRIGNQNDTVFTWTLSDYNGSNIFAADTDNTLNWLNLKELGINATNETEFDDFAELDLALNSTQFPDSVNKTFTYNNLPVLKKSFITFGYNLTNVSVSNSTNTSQFMTGIVWDMTNATHYNGTQDVAFVTEANTGLGSQGFYDYEIRVPATLRSYKGTTNTVSFYTELK